MLEKRRILGIDHGMKRVGIAVSDPMGILAQGIDTLQNDQNLLRKIVDIVKRTSARTIVIGKPLKLSGAEGGSAEEVRKFEVKLKEKLARENMADVEVVEWDERFTTTIAQRTQIEMGLKKKARQDKRNLDRMASQLILQSYLDSHRQIAEESGGGD